MGEQSTVSEQGQTQNCYGRSIKKSINAPRSLKGQPSSPHQVTTGKENKFTPRSLDLLYFYICLFLCVAVCEGRHARANVCGAQDNFPPSVLGASLVQLSARQSPFLDESAPSPMSEEHRQSENLPERQFKFRDACTEDEDSLSPSEHSSLLYLASFLLSQSARNLAARKQTE